MTATMTDAREAERATEKPRCGTRATIILGVASIFAGLGAALGGLFMIAIDGDSFPDYSPYSATGVVAGAGIGWLFGARAGSGLSRGARVVRRSVAVAMWIVAATAIGCGVALWVFWESFLKTTVLIEGELLTLRIATLGAALAVAATLLWASLVRRTDEDARPPGPVARAVSTVGILVLTALLATILLSTIASQLERLDAKTERGWETAERLLDNARAFQADEGRYPQTHRELIQGTRLDQDPDVEIRHFGEIPDGFCVTVALIGDVRRSETDDVLVSGAILQTGVGAPYGRPIDACGDAR